MLTIGANGTLEDGHGMLIYPDQTEGENPEAEEVGSLLQPPPKSGGRKMSRQDSPYFVKM
ncbi:MAG: hypothetical protein UY13_C0002G0211 [Candidatus Pacebacteria bacterium GW2011_GWB1_47_8]|nr:MAG: hypothetical protein UX28_C0001G0359 [Candidatus Pacebacteria bacterium GW2011_GWA1_46_10]KKU84299.1 MAG: hypothetical protein UY13_C0002G0211 [Candidatus Pacebacteria bacterium GW2011_GWB1_47_8]HCR81518.1 hypothetical protein [Candidatus Paceibacterota bacterium]